MKKVLFLGLGCLSAASFAQAQTVDPIMALSQTLFLPAENIFAEGQKPTIEQSGEGYVINVPSFKYVNDTVPAYALNLNKKAGTEGIYQVAISDASQYKNLGSLLKDAEVTIKFFEYKADLDPKESISPSQALLIKGLLKTFDTQGAEYGKIDAISVNSESSISEGGKFWSKAKVLISAPEMVSGLFNFKAKDFSMDTEGEILKPDFESMDDITNLGDLKMKMSLNGVSASSFLAPLSIMNVNFSLDADMKDDDVTKDATLNIKAHAGDVQVKTEVEQIKRYLPKTVDFDLTATGFTYEELNEFSKAQKALVLASENNKIPQEARIELQQKLEENLETKGEALIDNMKLDVNNVISSDNYAVELSGNILPKAETFVGNLKITNFEYLAPEPRVIDERVCESAKEKLTGLYMNSNGNFDEAQMNKVMTDVQNACDEGRGPLDALREYVPGAQKSKDAQGRDVVTFDVKLQNDTLYLNGKPLDGSKE